jgi:hypothetical protein
MILFLTMGVLWSSDSLVQQTDLPLTVGLWIVDEDDGRNKLPAGHLMPEPFRFDGRALTFVLWDKRGDGLIYRKARTKWMGRDLYVLLPFDKEEDKWERFARFEQRRFIVDYDDATWVMARRRSDEVSHPYLKRFFKQWPYFNYKASK